MKKLTKKELEEALPDYVFGRLDGEMAERFERDCKEYPDILNEIEDVRRVFAKVDKMNFDNLIDEKTRNLSVKVNNRISEKGSGKFDAAWFVKYIVPVAAVAVLSFFVFQNMNDNRIAGGNTPKFSDKLDKLTDPGEIDSIELDEYSVTENAAMPLSYAGEIGTEQEDIIENLVINNIGDRREIARHITEMSAAAGQYSVYDDLAELSEEEFQVLLEEMKNVEL